MTGCNLEHLQLNLPAINAIRFSLVHRIVAQQGSPRLKYRLNTDADEN